MNKDELKNVLDLHKKFVFGEAGGVRAYLRGAYLRGAYLRGAYLSGAYLNGAYLRGAYLNGAYLRGAYLSGADLSGADLRGAYLNGAYLNGAYLRGATGILSIGPIGSREDILFAVWHEKGELHAVVNDEGVISQEKIKKSDIYIKTGCFWGTIAEFKAAVKKDHANDQYGKDYKAACTMIETYFRKDK